MQLTVKHRTSYRYDGPVPYGLMQVRLTPRPGALQDVIWWDVSFIGGSRQLDFDDHHGNLVQLFATGEDVLTVEIVASGLVSTRDTNGIMRVHDSVAPLWLYTRQTPFTEPGDAIKDLALGLEKDSLDSLHELSGRIRSEVAYSAGDTGPTTTAEESASQGVGVCQDHSLIFISACRASGIPVRYVSGYLHVVEGEAEAASHAWAEAWVENLGWVGFDISNGVSPDERYVRIAAGVDYIDIAPITGLRQGAAAESLSVEVQVQEQSNQ